MMSNFSREKSHENKWFLVINKKNVVKNHTSKISPKYGGSLIDVLWCQPIKLVQVVSTSEFHEY